MAIKNGKIQKSQVQKQKQEQKPENMAKEKEKKDAFLSEMNEPVEKIETTEENPKTPVVDEWEKQDLGLFEFHNFVDSKDGKTKGNPEFIGTFLGKIWESGDEPDNENHVKGIHFHDDNGNLILVPTNYALCKYFYEAEPNKRYKIKFTGYKLKSDGKEVSQFEIYKAK